MILQNRIDLLLSSRDIQGLNDLLRNENAHVTFWGTRVVEVQGQGSVSLHSLAERVIILSLDDELLPINDRSTELHSLKMKMRDFLGQTDDQLDKANCVTKVLNFFQEFMQMIRYGNIRWSREQPYDVIRQQTAYPGVFGSRSEAQSHGGIPPQSPYSRIFGSS